MTPRVTGLLSEVSVRDVLRMLEQSRQTGGIEFKKGDASITVWAENGRIRFWTDGAVACDLSTLRGLVNWRAGTFELGCAAPDVRGHERDILPSEFFGWSS